VDRKLVQIGVVHSPYSSMEDIPIQSYISKEVGEVELFKEYEEGLKDIEWFSHLILLYLFHQSGGTSLLIKPFLDRENHGIFSTRYPDRPNHIGISIVRLLGRSGNILEVSGIDVADGTPLIDIKPYVPRFDQRGNAKIGWLEGRI